MPALDPSRFTPAERRLLARLTTPTAVQGWLNALPYNTEPNGATLRSFRSVVRAHRAHCLEAAIFAAVALEQHGLPPLVMSLESVDLLDHVLFVYHRHGRWGSVARSRDPGLHGRKPVFATPGALAKSYMDPYVDGSGRIIGYGVANLDTALGGYDWRLSERNVWKVERLLIDWPHRRIRMSERRYQWLRTRYLAYRDTHGGRKPWRYYEGRTSWTPVPQEFTRDRNREPAG